MAAAEPQQHGEDEQDERREHGERLATPVPGPLRIGAFARRVGVGPDLLRAWERRYGLLTLRDVGLAWERGELDISHEHVASQVLRGRLLALSRFWGRGAGPLVGLACPRAPAAVAAGVALGGRALPQDLLTAVAAVAAGRR